MYEQIKNIMKQVVPASWLQNHKSRLRKVVSCFYKGQSYECPICDFAMSAFIILKNGDKLCPHCGSLGRNRRLWEIIKNQINGKRILHFSPSASISSKIKHRPEVDYISSDYEGEFKADESYDIRSIPLKDETLDMIICYHVLEHITEDIDAMAELYRLLKFGGSCYIQSPFKEGNTYEDSSKVSAIERRLAFGQEDHVRIYSVSGLKVRLERCGFQVKVLLCQADQGNRYGYKENEIIIEALKK